MDLSQLFTAAHPDAVRVSIPLWLELMSVIVGGITGGIAASERKLDFVGAVTLAIICGLGGGLIRDVAMQVGDVYMLSSDVVLLSTAAAGLIAYYFSGVFKRLTTTIVLFDIVSVGLFTVTGTDKALVYGFSPVIAVFMGVVTGVGGGMLRDVLTGEVPNIFRGGTNLYAVCSVVGGVAYCACAYAQLTKTVCAIVCVVCTILVRLVSLRFGIVTPGPTDLTPKVVAAGMRAVQRGIEVGQENAEKHRRKH